MTCEARRKIPGGLSSGRRFSTWLGEISLSLSLQTVSVHQSCCVGTVPWMMQDLANGPQRFARKADSDTWLRANEWISFQRPGRFIPSKEMVSRDACLLKRSGKEIETYEHLFRTVQVSKIAETDCIQTTVSPLPPGMWLPFRSRVKCISFTNCSKTSKELHPTSPVCDESVKNLQQRSV